MSQTHRFAWLAAMLMMVACAPLTLRQDAPPSEAAREPPTAFGHSSVLQASNGYNCTVQVMGGTAMADLESGQPMRTISMTAVWTWRQVHTQAGSHVGTLAVDSADPIEMTFFDLSVSRARGFAAHAVDPDVLWDTPVEEQGQNYRVLAQPVEGLTWGAIERSDQVVVTLEGGVVNPFDPR